MLSSISLLIITVSTLAVTVFLIILLIRLAGLVREAESTLHIINNQLPASINEFNRLMNHAESSLNELDVTLKAVQDPLNKFTSITHAGQNMFGGNLGKIGGIVSGNLSKLLIGALMGGIAGLLRRFVSGLFQRRQK